MVLVERFNSRCFTVFYGSRYIAVDLTVEFSDRSVVGSGRTIHTHTTVIGRRLSYARRSGRRTVCLKPLYAASPLCAQFRAHFCRPLFGTMRGASPSTHVLAALSRRQRLCSSLRARRPPSVLSRFMCCLGVRSVCAPAPLTASRYWRRFSYFV